MTDYQGIALIITAVGTVAVQLVGVWRGEQRSGKLEEVRKSVNGQSEKLNAAIGKAARAEGVAAGIEEERASPMVAVKHE